VTRTSFVRVGRVARAHGLAGEVSVVMTSDVPADDLVGRTLWFVPPGEGARNALVRSVRQGPKGPLFRLAGFEDAHAVEAVRGRAVALAAADLPEGYEDLTFDPVGMKVFDRERGELGEIADVIETGANDVWVVEGGRFGQVLIPVIDDIELEIDEDEERIDVELLSGLIPEES
jgi:16S rRNA processing protein RimM